MKENEKLVNWMVDAGYLKNPRVIKAFKAVDRGNFVPEFEQDLAYSDQPLPIGEGQTISAPTMVAIMTEALCPLAGDKVLEIGAGSGYQAALIAEIIGSNGKVYTIERIASLAEFARANLKKYKNVQVIVADGSNGYEEKAPYDKIMVTAASPKIPEPLVRQLKKGGVMAIPVGSGFGQDFVLIKKDKNGKVSEEFVCGCVFVPLIGEHGHRI